MRIEPRAGNPEISQISLIAQAIPELKKNYSISKLERGQNNPTLNLYRVHGSQELLVKAFDRVHRENAQREIDQYNQISNLPFIARLRYARSIADLAFLGYQWIDGINLLDYFRTNEGRNPKRKEELSHMVIDQTLQMGNAIKPDYYDYLKEHGTKGSIAPLYPGLLSTSEEEKFAQDYAAVTNELQIACQKFPGLYIERNPGNAILHKKRGGEKLYQVDFGIMEATSPLFDLGMLFRQQTGEPSLMNLDDDPSIYIPSYDPQIEKTILNYTYDQFSSQSQFSWNGTKAEFLRAFKYVTLRHHIYYLTKSEVSINSGKTNLKVQEGRKTFHKKMLCESYDELIGMREPIEDLKPWIDRFTNL